MWGGTTRWRQNAYVSVFSAAGQQKCAFLRVSGRPKRQKHAKMRIFAALAGRKHVKMRNFTTHLDAYKTPSDAREVPPCFRNRGSHRQCEIACLRYSCRPICGATCSYRSLCSHGILRRPQDTTTRFRDAPRCIQSPRGSSRLGRTARNHHLLPRLRHLSPFLHHCFPRLLYT